MMSARSFMDLIDSAPNLAGSTAQAFNSDLLAAKRVKAVSAAGTMYRRILGMEMTAGDLGLCEYHRVWRVKDRA